MMEQYFEREKIIDVIKSNIAWWEDSAKDYREDRAGVTALRSLMKEIEELEIENISKTIHAKWIERDTGKGTRQYICSNCRDYHEFRNDSTNLHSVKGNFLYCRKCGARMGETT